MGLKAVRIPVIMDVENTDISANSDDKVKLIYAGSPANKDYLKEMVLGMESLAPDQQQIFEFHILGANEEQIKNLTGLYSLPTCIKAYGRVPREKVEETMRRMDFSVLLRPSKERYTKAGFSTKSVEAMSHGVAMICNISSDLGLYLKDGENAVIVDGYDKKMLSRVMDSAFFVLFLCDLCFAEVVDAVLEGFDFGFGIGLFFALVFDDFGFGIGYEFFVAELFHYRI